ncbi:MAG: polysaccharide deacetylase family protein [Eubacteriales bacterium]|nr:polysaccharide deacetylase family protein [Eubacteriales bacterium]
MIKGKAYVISLCLLGGLLAAESTVLVVRAAQDNSQSAAAPSQSTACNWGLSFPKSGQAPRADASAEELAPYDAHYLDSSGEKVIYLTFDAGYENGNTPQILDVLKAQNVPAAFFLVEHYYKTSPELVKRMAAEGHIVGNHTSTHPDMTQITDSAAFAKELAGPEGAYEALIGEALPKFYRPPQGRYSLANLAMAQKLGYTTVFWSLAYEDWNENNQPTEEAALKKLLDRTHPGAVVLLHSTSSTNAKILNRYLTALKEQGYTFLPLTELS